MLGGSAPKAETLSKDSESLENLLLGQSQSAKQRFLQKQLKEEENAKVNSFPLQLFVDY